MKYTTGFGRRLRDARRAAGLSQSALEKRSGVPKTTLSRYENERILPSLHTLEGLASALGVTTGSLLGDGQAIAERFLRVLAERGVRFRGMREAERLANLVADVLAERGEAEGAGIRPA